MKKASIVLFILQAIALIGGIANGSFSDMLSSGVAGIFELIGFCIPGIIGAILYVKADKKDGQ